MSPLKSAVHSSRPRRRVVIDRLTRPCTVLAFHFSHAGGAPRFVKSGALCVCVLKTARSICVEKFEALQQLGRFTLRDEGRTIGIGKVLRLGIARKPGAASGGGN